MYAVNVKEDEQMPLSKTTKTVSVKCKNIVEGDILESKILGDSVKVVKIVVGEFSSKITFGSGEQNANTATLEYDNMSSLIKIERATLN